MKQRRSDNHLAMPQRFIAEAEARVKKQKQLIARLRESGHPTQEAEALLVEYVKALIRLRNHLDVMDELMKPDRKQ
jgi:hypothetical protein